MGKDDDNPVGLNSSVDLFGGESTDAEAVSVVEQTAEPKAERSEASVGEDTLERAYRGEDLDFLGGGGTDAPPATSEASVAPRVGENEAPPESPPPCEPPEERETTRSLPGASIEPPQTVTPQEPHGRTRRAERTATLEPVEEKTGILPPEPPPTEDVEVPERATVRPKPATPAAGGKAEKGERKGQRRDFVLHVEDDDDDLTLDPSFLRHIDHGSARVTKKRRDSLELDSIKWKEKVAGPTKTPVPPEDPSLIVLEDKDAPTPAPAKNSGVSINKLIDQALDGLEGSHPGAGGTSDSPAPLPRATGAEAGTARTVALGDDREDGTEKVTVAELEAYTRKIVEGPTSSTATFAPIEPSFPEFPPPSPPALPVGEPAEVPDDRAATQVVALAAEAYLECLDGKLPWKRHSIIKEKTVLGRSSQNDVVIPHTSCSRQHAAILHAGGAFHIVDMGSTNGIQINKQKVRKALLGDGDEVQVGDFLFRFVRVLEVGTDGSTRVAPTAAPDEERTLAQAPPTAFPLETNPLGNNPLGKLKGLLGGSKTLSPSPAKAAQSKGMLSPKARRLLFILLGLGFLYAILDTFVGAPPGQGQGETGAGPGASTAQGATSLQGELRTRFDLYYQHGLEKFEIGNYLDARTEFEKAQKLDPASVIVKDYLSRANCGVLLENEIAEKQRLLKDELTQKQEIKDLLTRGEQQFRQADYVGALEMFQRVLELEPENRDAREWVEKVQYELTDGERNRSLEESKKVFSDFFAKAQEAAESGDLHAAITYSRKLLDNEYARENSFIPTITKNIELWESSINDLLKREINQAEAMWQGGDFVQARKLLADLRQKYPDNQDLEKRFNEYDGLLLDKANGFYRNGRLKEEFLNDYEAAKQDYREALKLLEPTAELYKKVSERLAKLE